MRMRIRNRRHPAIAHLICMLHLAVCQILGVSANSAPPDTQVGGTGRSVLRTDRNPALTSCPCARPRQKSQTPDNCSLASIVSWSAQFQREGGCSLPESAPNQWPLTDDAMRVALSACRARMTRSTGSTPIGRIRLIGLIGPIRPEKVRGPPRITTTTTTTSTPRTREISLRCTLISRRVSGPVNDRSLAHIIYMSHLAGCQIPGCLRIQEATLLQPLRGDRSCKPARSLAEENGKARHHNAGFARMAGDWRVCRVRSREKHACTVRASCSLRIQRGFT